MRSMQKLGATDIVFVPTLISLLRDRRQAQGEVTVELRATKAAIASQLGLTAVHLSRVLHDLAARGLLRVDRRRIVIPDAARLAGAARRGAAAGRSVS